MTGRGGHAEGQSTSGGPPPDVRFHTFAGGRRIAWSEYGDPHGVPVVWNHGGLSCRLDAARAHDPALAAGARVIAPDRPGIGWSEREPGRTVVSWGADIEALADHLGLDRFAVLGWSAGGPHALSCAAALPERVTRVATCGGMAPLRSRADTKELGLAVDRLMFPLAQRAPSLAARLVSLASGRRGPEKAKVQMLKALGETDRAVLADWPAKELVGWEGNRVATFAHGPQGTVDDYRAVGAPDWGFAFADVEAHVDCWHGADDELVPRSHAERLASTLPDAELRVVPGSGHFIPAQPDRLTEVLRTLVA